VWRIVILVLLACACGTRPAPQPPVIANHGDRPLEGAQELFRAANAYRRDGQLELAIPLYREIITKHRHHEVAEYAANLLFDCYNRLQRYDDFLDLVQSLVHDDDFLAGRPDLRDYVERLARPPMKTSEKLTP
jgi:hypothetical protein